MRDMSVPIESSSSSTSVAQRRKMFFASSMMSTRSSGVKRVSAVSSCVLKSALMSSPSWGPKKCQKDKPRSVNPVSSPSCSGQKPGGAFKSTLRIQRPPEKTAM